MLIVKVTITDHYQKKSGRETITNEFILEMLEKKLNNEKLEPRSDYSGARKVFR